MIRPLAAFAVLLAFVAAGCGGSGNDSTSSTQAASTTATTDEIAWEAPLVLDPPRKSPDFTLRDYTGKQVSLSDYKGKAVMITFVYSQCPDVCQVIVNALAATRKRLGPQADDMQIIAVSVDPKGDTPENVRKFLDARGLVGKADFLIGTRAELKPVWDAYGVQVEGSKETPDLLAHSSFIYGLDGQLVQRVLYPADPLDPGAIAHDVPLLVNA